AKVAIHPLLRLGRAGYARESFRYRRTREYDEVGDLRPTIQKCIRHAGFGPSIRLEVCPSSVLFWGVPIARENGFAQLRAIEWFWGFIHVDLVAEKVRDGEGAIASTRGACAPQRLRLGVNFRAGLRE